MAATTTIDAMTLGEHELAMLSGGPDLAITCAAVRLRAKLIARPGRGTREFIASGDLSRDAAPLERELFDAVRRGSHGTSSWALQRGLADSASLERIASGLTAAGLLRAPSLVSRARAALRMGRGRPRATARGRAVVRQWREQRPDLRANARPAEVGLAVALFGGAALWAADPGFAAAWGASAQPWMWWSGGDYGGGDCGGCAGCGGCGGCG